jgi:hypothetical protein
MGQQKIRAFLEIPSDDKFWDLPERYTKAIMKHVESTPTTFYVEWPPEVIPAVGHTIMLYELPGTLGEDLTVQKVEHGFSQKSLDVYITTNLKADFTLDVRDLTFLAEAGCLFDSKTSIAEALEAAGLPTIVDDLPRSLNPHAAFRRLERTLPDVAKALKENGV